MMGAYLLATNTKQLLFWLPANNPTDKRKPQRDWMAEMSPRLRCLVKKRTLSKERRTREPKFTVYGIYQSNCPNKYLTAAHTLTYTLSLSLTRSASGQLQTPIQGLSLSRNKYNKNTIRTTTPHFLSLSRLA
jgi:hypothetical protein